MKDVEYLQLNLSGLIHIDIVNMKLKIDEMICIIWIKEALKFKMC